MSIFFGYRIFNLVVFVIEHVSFLLKNYDITCSNYSNVDGKGQCLAIYVEFNFHGIAVSDQWYDFLKIVRNCVMYGAVNRMINISKIICCNLLDKLFSDLSPLQCQVCVMLIGFTLWRQYDGCWWWEPVLKGFIHRGFTRVIGCIDDNAIMNTIDLINSLVFAEYPPLGVYMLINLMWAFDACNRVWRYKATWKTYRWGYHTVYTLNSEGKYFIDKTLRRLKFITA